LSQYQNYSFDTDTKNCDFDTFSIFKLYRENSVILHVLHFCT